MAPASLRGHDRLWRLRRRGRARDRNLRPLADRRDAHRRLDEPRPARRTRAAHPRRDRRRDRLRLLGRAATRWSGRVLRTRDRCGRRHGLLRERGEPDDAVPGARVVLALPLCPRRHRHRPGDLARGRPEVRDRGRLRLGGAALRLGARLRGDRQARLLGDRGGERVERRVPRRGLGDDPRRAHVQDLGGALPHVDA